jgi:hypothetical protein
LDRPALEVAVPVVAVAVEVAVVAFAELEHLL